MLEAAAKFPDLSAEQRDQVRAISQEYARAAAPLNDRWAQAVQAQEDQSGGTFGVMSKMWTGGGEGADAVKDARKARTDLDAQTADRLRALLTPEQVERLPERKSDEWNPMADFLSPEDAEAMKELQEAAGGGK
jgi:Spy/CpxP family protein refolding chaperone